MIDTRKYEGHTPAPWTVNVHKVGQDTSAIVIESSMTTHSNDVLAEVEVENNYALIDAQLIADAPLLLAEVKRLREELALYEKYDICHPDGTHCCDECLERNGFEAKKND